MSGVTHRHFDERLMRALFRAAYKRGVLIPLAKLLDNVIRAQQERRRNVEADGLGGLQIDDKLELG
jgi:hypothetical protein